MTAQAENTPCLYGPAALTSLALWVTCDGSKPERVDFTDTAVRVMHASGVRHLMCVLAAFLAGSLVYQPPSDVELGYFEWDGETGGAEPSTAELVTVTLVSHGVVEAMRELVASRAYGDR